MTERMPGRPDFLVIGAMKCGTTTLHEQLAHQPGIAMSRPKEPNFFSNDPIFAWGLPWYATLFEHMPAEAIRGESSTHYAKLPTYPHACERIRHALPDVKIVYAIRHPIERLVSHYWHEWLEGTITEPIDRAIKTHTELIDYGRYAMQLAPYINAFGRDRICMVALERFSARPQDEFARLCAFLGVTEPAVWDENLAPQNVGRERMRRSGVRHAVVNAPVLSEIRRQLVPRPWVEKIKQFWQVDFKRPALSDSSKTWLMEIFDRDLAELSQSLRRPLTCQNFVETITNDQNPLAWKDGLQRDETIKPRHAFID